MDDLFVKVRRMCEIITGNMFGNKELDSLALEIGHDDRVLNAARLNTCSRRAQTDGYLKQCPLWSSTKLGKSCEAGNPTDCAEAACEYDYFIKGKVV